MALGAWPAQGGHHLGGQSTFLEVISSAETGIATEVTLEVLEVFKGEADLIKVLTLPGGSYGGETLHINAVPTFDLGEQVILSLGDKTVGPFDIMVGGTRSKVTVKATQLSKASEGATVQGAIRAALLTGGRYKSSDSQVWNEHQVKGCACSHPANDHNHGLSKARSKTTVPICLSP